MITWCVAYTKARGETAAKQNLLAQGFEAYLPQFKKTRRHARKVEEVSMPLFPRYIFIGMDLESAQFGSVNGTRGVSHLVMADDIHPAQLSTNIIEDLKLQEISDGIVPIASLISFTKGDRVRIVEGAFKDQIASFEMLDGKARVQLLLGFLGREAKASLPIYSVEAE